MLRHTLIAFYSKSEDSNENDLAGFQYNADEHAERFADGFGGVPQIDGHAGHNRLTGRGRKGGARLRLAYC